MIPAARSIVTLALLVLTAAPALAWAEPGETLLATGTASAEPRVGFAPAGVGLDDRRGARVPLEAQFKTLEGTPVRLGAVLRPGKPALLVLAYNRCAMLCNLVLRGVSDGVRGLELEPDRDFELVTISIDPRDTAPQLTRVQQSALARAGYEGQLRRWRFLTGAEPEIARVAASVGFRYQWDPRTEQYAHPAVVIVLSSAGRVSHYLQGLGWSRDELRVALRRAASESASTPSSALESASAAGAAFRTVMQCFRPDTANSKYGSWVTAGLRSGAGLALGALVLVIVRARRARRA